MEGSWTVRWVVASLAIVPVAFFLTRGFYFQTDSPISLSLAAPQYFNSIYCPNWGKAQSIYFCSLVAIYYATYVLTSLLFSHISKVSAAVHLAIWTIFPPLWLSFERYFYFDTATLQGEELQAALGALKEGQDYASKFWAAILAVMLAYRLGEIIKSPSPTPPQAPRGSELDGG